MTCSNCGTLFDSGARFCPSCGAALGAPAAAAPLVAGWQGERTAAMLCHLSALAGMLVPFGNILGPLIVWLVKRDESPLVDREGKESLNFQISMSIYMVISALLILLLVGIPMLVVFGLLDLILTVVAAVKTSNGEAYRYPLTIRFLR
ncbi:MAG: DUF4870 domain-containing protein [Candidatus Eremiobacteraeota bacterium]|uniref:Putative zinc-ribbon domain-containing protein n=1 Tax=mine drainage metagenome TaxID=410659 RepID=E6PCJ5_9ZZZZ|nr:DUF4870 domain-containing protein [Candidatus Eremiobacteraeota bacterium]